MPTIAANTVLYIIPPALWPAVDTYSLVQSTATPPTTTLDGVVSVAESVMRLTLEAQLPIHIATPGIPARLWQSSEAFDQTIQY